MQKPASISRPRGSLDRRHFLKTAGAAAILSSVLPGCAWQTTRRTPPSGRITMGVIGWGMQGPGNTKNFLYQDDCQVVAACDLDQDHLRDAVGTINDHYQNKDCKAYSDYRELLAREDIDAVMIAIPDHWHALVATEAARRGKDIYGEKPLAKTVKEQQAIVKAVEKHGVIWQTGSWQRSVANFRKGAEIVRSGLIGTVTRVEVGLPSGHNDFAGTEPALLKKLASLPGKITSPAEVVPGTPAWDLAVTPPPAALDYERWIGPSQMEPYIEARVHRDWRWNYNTGGGQLMDWIGHHCDIAHWGLGFDHTGPSEVEGQGDFPAANAIWNTSTKYRVEAKYDRRVTGYPADVTMIIAGGHSDIASGTKWIGTDGWVWVDRADDNKKVNPSGFDASNSEWKHYKNLPDELAKVKLYVSNNHQRNFLDCVKSRQPTITPVQTGHHSTIPGHLGLISMLVGRKLRWDVEREKIVDDPAATELLSRPYRKPWHLA
jgi:predicted dehydrogenase